MWRNLFILYFVFVKKQRTIERKKKRSKISGLESCYANRIYVLIGVELGPYGQKLVQFCKHTHTRVSFSSKDNERVHRKKQHASSIRTIPLKNIAFIHVFCFESSNSMQYRSMLCSCLLNFRSDRFKTISSTERIVRSFEHK